MEKIGLILVLIFCIGFISCEKKEVYKAPEVEDFLPMLAKHVEVPEGQMALVRFYDDTLAIVTETADVMVPKVGINSRAFENAVTVEYLKNDNNLGKKYEVWETVAFEDSENGDYDYNDLVFQVRIRQGRNTEFMIQPIALGCTKPITLGVRIGDHDVILFEDCRTGLFEKMTGFINTEIDKPMHKFENIYSFKENIPCTYGKDIHWFIEVDNGHRLYAVSKDHPSFNSEKMAYGLIFTNIHEPYKFGKKNCGMNWFVYPQEKVRIDGVYPKFDFFQHGGAASFHAIFSKPEGDFYFSINADDKRRVTAEKCLYATSLWFE